MSKESAELTKYAANAFLATKISFINEMSKLCEATGASISEVKKGMGADIRIGNHFLNAGLGYGGSCFPKDVSALIDTFRKLKLGPTILEHTKRINEEQLDNFIKKIESNLSFSKLAIWGLSFKPNSDDIRESVAIKLIKKLSPKADQLNLYDPIAMEPAAKELKALPNISFLNNRSSTLLEVDALIICTELEEFKILSKEEIKMLRNKIIFDGRNILNRNFIESNQVVYYGIGE